MRRMSAHERSDNEEESIVHLFDSICFSFGDQDAIVLDGSDAVCYYEIQEASKALASQLFYRYRPDYVLIECLGHAVAEAVSILACMRINAPFVPVDLEAGNSRRIKAVVDALASSRPLNQSLTSETAHIVAICCCENDEDPLLGVLYQAEVHRVVYLDRMGTMMEQIRVPDIDVESPRPRSDDLYVLFTSGTTSNQPKAVVGSHQSTFRRLKWWRDSFSASPRIARRTRLTFVDGITELLSALLHPPSVLVALSRPDRLNAEGTLVLLEDLAPSQITLLPSQLWQLLTLVDNGAKHNPFHSLERIVCSGEVFSVALWRRIETVLLPALPSLQILNLYGQTESTGDVLCADLTDMDDATRISRGSVMAVGKPIRDDVVVTTSTTHNEIIVSGNLAIGYLSQAPSLPPPRLTSFATGDVGYCDKGTWYVQGRIDDVEKINGVWTSPSETEAAVARVFKVKHPVAASIVDGRVYLVSENAMPEFSRQVMRDAGYGWNVIPQQVLCRKLPVNQESAAGKVDRRELRTIISEALAGSLTDLGKTCETNPLAASVVEVLSAANSCGEFVDMSRSFVEVGGDSASAVALLHLLRRRGLVGNTSTLTATAILRASSLQELSDAVQDGRPIHLVGESAVQRTNFEPRKLPTVYSSTHSAIPFRGCVDASPVVSLDGSMAYVGCQGGLLQKICTKTCTVVAHRLFPGFMIQADCVITSRSVIVCLYKRGEDRGMVLSLSHDLSTTIWETAFRGEIVSTPIFTGTTELCSVIGGHAVAIVDIETGLQVCEATLPECTNARPIRWNDGQSFVLLVGEHGALMKVDLKKDETLNPKLEIDVLERLDGVAPIYKDVLVAHDEMILTSSSGSICKCARTTSNIACCQLSSFPLSPAESLGDAGYVVGSYDGFVYLWKGSGSSVKVHVGACVYAKPLALPRPSQAEISFVVCTTAGDIVRVSFDEPTDSLHIVERYRIAAEIWSNPVLWGQDRVVVGARDSKIHMIQLQLSRSTTADGLSQTHKKCRQ